MRSLDAQLHRRPDRPPHFETLASRVKRLGSCAEGRERVKPATLHLDAGLGRKHPRARRSAEGEDGRAANTSRPFPPVELHPSWRRRRKRDSQARSSSRCSNALYRNVAAAAGRSNTMEERRLPNGSSSAAGATHELRGDTLS